jgi:hypothetical protein
MPRYCLWFFCLISRAWVRVPCTGGIGSCTGQSPVSLRHTRQALRQGFLLAMWYRVELNVQKCSSHWARTDHQTLHASSRCYPSPLVKRHIKNSGRDSLLVVATHGAGLGCCLIDLGGYKKMFMVEAMGPRHTGHAGAGKRLSIVEHDAHTQACEHGKIRMARWAARHTTHKSSAA